MNPDFKLSPWQEELVSAIMRRKGKICVTKPYGMGMSQVRESIRQMEEFNLLRPHP
jgi:hypothetical protein